MKPTLRYSASTVLHRASSLAGLATVLVTTACSDRPRPTESYLDEPAISATLAANDFCIPTEQFSDGLGGLNPMAGAYGGALMSLECDEGPPEEDPDPGAPGIWMYGWDYASCFSGFWDIDADGVHNACENALAQHFAPELVMTSRCDWDSALDRMGGEYYFAVQAGVQRGRSGGISDIRIAYLPAYYVDCGAVSELCSYPLVPECGGHTGDSEFFLIDLSYDATTMHWVTDAIFLSAHCPNGGTSDDCNWQDTAHFGWRDGRSLGAPVIWVSESKKANYYSESDCDAGGGPGWPLNSDTCEFSNRVIVFPVMYGQQNIGSRSTPLRDCAAAFSGSPMTQAGAVECLWSRPLSGRFNGWQFNSVGDDPMMYTDVLSIYARF